MNLREAAHAYAARGWPVFPCWPGKPGDPKSGKDPLTPHGFKDASTNPTVIDGWWDRYPDANIGIPTGKAIGAWVLDVDGEKGSASLTQLEGELGALPDTLEQQTGSGGRHLFFTMPERHVGCRIGFRPGLDVRANGGYVIAPPSLHHSGRRYNWPNGEKGMVASPKAWVDFVSPVAKVLPPWERVAPKDPPRRPPPITDLVRTPIIERARLYLNECDPAISGSGGHNKLLWACRALVVGFELTDAQSLQLLWSDYNPRCQPPWDENDERDKRDFERKVGEARRTPGQKPSGWLLDEFGLRSSTEALAMIARGGESAANLLAAAAKRAAASPEPIPLEPPKAAALPTDRREFPIQHFPGPVRDFCLAVSDSHNVDLSFAALPVLVVAGAAIGNSTRLELKKGFVVPPTLWGGLVSPSGTNKSGPLRDVVSPLRRHITADMIPGATAMVNPQGRVVVSDATLEAVVARLQDSRRGLLVFRDELAGWTKSFNAYKSKGGGGDEQAWLEFWDAGVYTVDRKTNNEQISIPAASCAILGGIQPKILLECFDPSRFASGLVPRILIACPPRREMFWREEEIDPEAEARWAEVVTWLRLIPFEGIDTNSGKFTPRVVKLTKEAKVAYKAFYNSITWESEQQVTDENAQAVFAKARTQAARLALIHHGLRLACGDRNLDAPVELASVEAGNAWARWFLDEQLRVYGFGGAEYRRRQAEELAAAIREKLPTPSATARQIQRLNGRRWSSANAANAAMAMLVELGHARWADDQRDKVILN